MREGERAINRVPLRGIRRKREERGGERERETDRDSLVQTSASSTMDAYI